MLQISRAWRDAVGIADDGLDDNRRDFSADAIEQSGRGLEIIEGQGGGEVRQRFRYARRGRHAQGQHARARFHQEGIAVAVVATLEFHHPTAPSGSASQTDGRQRGFGAGIDHPHHFTAGDQPGNGLCHDDFQRVRRAKAEAVARGRDHRLQHRRMIVAGDHRPPRAYVIDITVAVGVIEIWAVGALDEERFAAH
jgi:hypothetical protein